MFTRDDVDVIRVLALLACYVLTFTTAMVCAFCREPPAAGWCLAGYVAVLLGFTWWWIRAANRDPR